MKNWFLLSLIIFLGACSGSEPSTPVSDRNSSLTQGNIQLYIKTGTTTKADILEKFGAPNVTTRDSAGREVWTYQRSAQASQSQSNSNFWTAILAGQNNANTGLASSSRMLTLIVKFNAQDIVSDFNSRASDF